MHHTEHQNVEDAFAKLPLSAVKREHPRLRDIHQRHHCLRDLGVIQLAMAKKAMQAFDVRVSVRFAAKGGCELQQN